MLDEKDLQAIAKMMEAQKQDILELMEQQKQDILEQTNANMRVLLELHVEPQLKLLAEGQQEIRTMLVPRSRVDDLEEEVKFLKTVIRQITEDVQQLKKAL